MFSRRSLISNSRLLFAFFISILSPALLSAEVVRVEVTARNSARRPGYEQITGRFHFEIDPKLPVNAVIADIELAPVNDQGRVCFSSDFALWKPTDDSHANGAAWLEVPNRGSRSSPGEWIVEQGFVQLNVGWEFDVPNRPEPLRIEVPRARNSDGSPVRGLATTTFVLNQRDEEFQLNTLLDYPAVNLQGEESQLLMRTRSDLPQGEIIPRARWSTQGDRLRLQGGFEPGRTYDFSYLSEGPPIAGLGNAAIRDAAAWLKHSPDSLAPVKYVHAFGSSQCGRMLRDWVYLGFNTDEQDRPVLDGIFAHVAGAGRLVLNERWSTPRAVAGYATSSFPFADRASRDPVTGHTDGVVENLRVKHPPKIFYINMSAEYWGAGRVAALTHVTPDGKQDLPFPENVRSYFFSGTSHGPAPFPPQSLIKGAPLANPVSSRDSMIPLRQALHRWVTEDVPPPASVHPRLSDGTLIPISNIQFPHVPGLSSPAAVTAGGRMRNPQYADGAGAGTELPLLVPQVDADGNDLGGIRVPEIAVPLATATGWVFRPMELGSPHEFYLLRGAWVPFAKTRAEREATGDTRLSIEERYPSKADYLAKVKLAAQELIEQKFLSDTDLDAQLKRAGERWDWVMSH